MASGVALRDVTFYSSALRRQMPYRVLLPAEVLPGQKLPVVYLLHGGTGNFRDWSNDFDVARYAKRGLILVMPEGAFSFYLNSAGKPEDKYEDYVTTDLIGDVESRFPAAKGREHRALMGISMGGFGAIKLGLSHPDLFSFIAALGPSIDVPHRWFDILHLGEWENVYTIFGPYGSKSRQSRDPLVLVESADPAAAPYFYLTSGDRDALLKPNLRFAAILRQRHFAYEFHTDPGGHSWSVWNSQLPDCFERLLAHLRSNR
jgi:S-formylglutathione hydrolase FrmB